ncbi:MAG: PHP domain-containing protein [Promethearchaeota archaeon]|jgi:DNA polymerase (family 10)
MKFPSINLHIHSNFSDGKNSIKQIVGRALEVNLDYIAITDHITDSWKAWVSKLKNQDIIREYLEEISNCQVSLKRNNSKLTVFKGIEIDLGSSEIFIKKMVQPIKYDLILFEYLESVEGLAFLQNLINFWKVKYPTVDNFPIFGLAHFDPAYFIYGYLDTLIQFLEKNSIYFEFNSRYPEYYSLQNEEFFKRLRDSTIPVAIGGDSHSISNLSNTEEPLEMIKYYNLEDNLICLLKKFSRIHQT